MQELNPTPQPETPALLMQTCVDKQSLSLAQAIFGPIGDPAQTGVLPLQRV
jgi:hypothetical protein